MVVVVLAFAGVSEICGLDDIFYIKKSAQSNFLSQRQTSVISNPLPKQQTHCWLSTKWDTRYDKSFRIE